MNSATPMDVEITTASIKMASTVAYCDATAAPAIIVPAQSATTLCGNRRMRAAPRAHPRKSTTSMTDGRKRAATGMPASRAMVKVPQNALVR